MWKQQRRIGEDGAQCRTSKFPCSHLWQELNKRMCKLILINIHFPSPAIKFAICSARACLDVVCVVRVCEFMRKIHRCTRRNEPTQPNRFHAFTPCLFSASIRAKEKKTRREWDSEEGGVETKSASSQFAIPMQIISKYSTCSCFRT